MPLNHIFERVVIEWTSFRYGGTISFVESIEKFGQNLKDVQPHVFAAAPRVWTKLQMGILSKFSQKTLDTLLKIPLLSGLLKKLLKKGLGFSKSRVTVSGSAPMPVELIESNNDKVIYDPSTQLSIYQMGGGMTTSSSRSTDGTKPKNEADRVMDDN